jgi:predicted GNAT superfamily acetyltransferase
MTIQRPSNSYTIRTLGTPEDYRAFESLQREVWGSNIAEVITGSMAAVVQKIGGIAAGAFDEKGQMIGLVFGFTGFKDGLLVHWSHMLAVREGLRNSGVGRQLKLYQREQLLKLGVEEVFWSYDPLVARNASLNFDRLGVSAVEYVLNMYGPGDDSELFRGLGTDRLIVVWGIAKEYVRAVLDGRMSFHGRPFASAPLVVSRRTESDPNSPPILRAGIIADKVRIEIPEDIHLIRDTSVTVAAEWREATRKAFQSLFANQFYVAGFYRDESLARCFYCLQKTR